MNLLENRGVQMMLVNLLKTAAPDLVEHVDSIAKLIKEFNDRLIVVQTQNAEILKHMEALNVNAGRQSHATILGAGGNSGTPQSNGGGNQHNTGTA